MRAVFFDPPYSKRTSVTNFSSGRFVDLLFVRVIMFAVRPFLFVVDSGKLKETSLYSSRLVYCAHYHTLMSLAGWLIRGIS